MPDPAPQIQKTITLPIVKYTTTTEKFWQWVSALLCLILALVILSRKGIIIPEYYMTNTAIATIAYLTYKILTKPRPVEIFDRIQYVKDRIFETTGAVMDTTPEYCYTDDIDPALGLRGVYFTHIDKTYILDENQGGRIVNIVAGTPHSIKEEQRKDQIVKEVLYRREKEKEISLQLKKLGLEAVPGWNP